MARRSVNTVWIGEAESGKTSLLTSLIHQDIFPQEFAKVPALDGTERTTNLNMRATAGEDEFDSQTDVVAIVWSVSVMQKQSGFLKQSSNYQESQWNDLFIFLTQYISDGTCENVCSFQYITSWLWNSSRLNSVKFIGQSLNIKGNFLLTTSRIMIEFRHYQKVKPLTSFYVHLKNFFLLNVQILSKLLNSSSPWKKYVLPWTLKIPAVQLMSA